MPRDVESAVGRVRGACLAQPLKQLLDLSEKNKRFYEQLASANADLPLDCVLLQGLENGTFVLWDWAAPGCLKVATVAKPRCHAGEKLCFAALGYYCSVMVVNLFALIPSRRPSLVIACVSGQRDEREISAGKKSFARHGACFINDVSA